MRLYRTHRFLDVNFAISVRGIPSCRADVGVDPRRRFEYGFDRIGCEGLLLLQEECDESRHNRSRHTRPFDREESLDFPHALDFIFHIRTGTECGGQKLTRCGNIRLEPTVAGWSLATEGAGTTDDNAEVLLIARIALPVSFADVTGNGHARIRRRGHSDRSRFFNERMGVETAKSRIGEPTVDSSNRGRPAVQPKSPIVE